MIRKRSAALVGALGLAGVLVAVVPAIAEEPGEKPKAAMTFEACPSDVAIPPIMAGLVQCAKLPVPLDYADPDGPQIELMVSRLASTRPEKRRGVLMFNPGGPGGTGLDQPAFLASKGLPNSVLDAYDLIGMDTRGVGHSTRMSCGFLATDPYYGNIPPYAGDDASVSAQAKIAEGIADRCATTDARLRHLTTANTARDLDRIRAALGETKAGFYGASYGSALGAAYVSMFPDTTDRVVLDSNVGDTYLDYEGMRRYGQGMEETFVDFARWVAARHSSYGLGRTAQEVRRTYLETGARLDQTPAADGTTGAIFRAYVFVGLYSETSYGGVARKWQEWLTPGEPPAPAPESAPAPNPGDNNLTVFLAVTCNDSDWPEDVETYRRGVAEDRKRYPLYGPAAANILPCAYWKHEPAEPPVAINDDGPRNVLILQNRHDPVTPYAGGKLLREKFDQRSRLVTAEESGHGVYVLSGNACALNLTTSYLVDGVMPARDTTCRRG
ncbi:alpha/beta fold hydrolase [Actinoplanes sp. LDG1-06]|uniref:Alpha/beta fold hydrolase n=1 Tax=Paractinoplanes ovalisporus TaxID=2810368 RepID=A0ABS2AHY7_9ACTN|nr:alpha/beta hydrolase [Actinoplanes ovalisporus]MBM2619432.1 alpha/beta fold hydrolase [Actinoplanes ovalisporus]